MAVVMLLLVGVGVSTFAQTLDSRPFYRSGGCSAVLSPNFTKAEIDSLVNLVATGQKIQIMGTASPDGDMNKNCLLAERRAKYMLRQMKKKTGLPDSAFVLHAQVLTWRDLYEHVLGDEQVPARDSVLNLLDSAGQQNGRVIVRQLRRLSGGSPLLYIKSNLLPLMRTALVSAGDRQPEYQVAQSTRIGQQRQVARFFTPRRSETVTKVVPKGTQPHLTARVDASVTHPVDTVAPQEKRDTANLQSMPPVSIVEKPVSSRGYWIAIALLAAALAGVLCYGIVLLRRKNSELRQARQIIMIREQRIRELEGQQTVHDRLIGDGEKLYQDILRGGSAANWSNRQTKEFVDYYSVVNPMMMDNIEQQYNELPPSNVMYLILLDMGKTDAEIQQIMGISQTTIRSIRFRIKSKLKK